MSLTISLTLSRPPRLSFPTLVKIALAVNIVASLIIAPLTAYPFDIAGLTGNVEAWLRWGWDPFYYWKFGTDLLALAFTGVSTKLLFQHLGLGGAVAFHLGWKLPLIAANVVLAASIYRLGREFSLAKARTAALLWLLNPVAIWVAAGHGQVETVALAMLFCSCSLVISGRPLAAGLLSGLGVGIEFFPIAALLFIAALFAGRKTDARSVLKFALAAGLGIAVSFFPLAYDDIYRASFTNGFGSSSGRDMTDGSTLSIWPYLHAAPIMHHWLSVFAIVVVASFVMLNRGAREPVRAALLTVVAALLAAVLLDSFSLPQFSVIVVACGFFLAILDIVPFALSVIFPIFALAGCLYDAPLFFFDVAASAPAGATLWDFGIDRGIAAVYNFLYVAGLISLGLSVVFSKMLQKRLRWVADQKFALCSSIALLGVMCWWVATAPFWPAFFDRSVSELADFSLMTAHQSGAAKQTRSGADIRFSDPLIRMSRRATVAPAGTLTFTSAPGLLPVTSASGGSAVVVAPQWARPPATSRVALELALSVSVDTDSILPLMVNGRGRTMRVENWSVSRGPHGTHVFHYLIDTKVLRASSVLKLAPVLRRGTVLHYGSLSRGGSAYFIAPSAGIVRAVANGVTQIAYTMQSDGLLVANNLPPTNHIRVVAPFPISAPDARLNWSPASPYQLDGTLLYFIGILSLIATILTIVLALGSMSATSRFALED